MLFTPIQDGKRIKMEIEKQDLPRGYYTNFTVVELETSKKYLCRTRDCGADNCICDAEILGEI